MRSDAAFRDEIDLFEYGRILWRYRLLIAVITLLSGAIAFWIATREPKRYLATTKVIVPGATNVNHQIDQYKALLDNRDLAAATISDFGLDKPPYRLTPPEFLRSTLSIDDVGAGTNMVNISATFPDPQLAANVANRYQAHAGELLARMSREQNVGNTEMLKSQLQVARERLTAADAALNQYKNSAQVELVRKDVNSLLDERGHLLQLTVDLEGERARLAAAERELTKQQPTTAAPSAVDLGDTLHQTAGDGTKLRSETVSPYLNPVYQILEQQIAMSRTRVAGLERQKAELVSALKLTGPQLAQLSQLYTKEAELQRLQTEADLSRKIFADLASQYEQARATVSNPTMQVQVVVLAAPPDSPLKRNRMLRTEIALLIGFALSSVGALLLHFVRRSSRSASEVEKTSVAGL